MTARILSNSELVQVALQLMVLQVDDQAHEAAALVRTVHASQAGQLLYVVTGIAAASIARQHEADGLDDPALTLRNVALHIANEQEN